jgi:hypothetical protein
VRKAEELAQARDEDEIKARDAYLRELQTTAIKAMDKEALRREAQTYLKENPDKERFYDPAKVGFTNPIERIGFNIWLQGRVQVEFDEAGFELWRQSRSKRPGR